MKLTKQEGKILVYNKMKQKGLSYTEACKEVRKEAEHLQDLSKQKKLKNG